MPVRREIIIIAHNVPETRGCQPEGLLPYFPSERALTSLLQLPNDPTAYLAIPDCSDSYSSLKKLQPTGAKNMAHFFCTS
jgi:hypothetical protein